MTKLRQIRRLCLASLLLAAGSLCGCAPDKPADGAREAATTAATPEPAAPTTPVSTEAGHVSQYTSLANCRPIEESAPGEGDYSVHACPGIAGYALKLSEDDLRQNLWVQPPGGSEESLALSETTRSGGFSRIGDTVEWRGREEGGNFRPEALILRYYVVEEPDAPGKETGYLLTVTLAPRPCVAAKVQPGPDQNQRARDVADGPMRCLT
jgi:hypothetical protein